MTNNRPTEIFASHVSHRLPKSGRQQLWRPLSCKQRSISLSSILRPQQSSQQSSQQVLWCRGLSFAEIVVAMFVIAIFFLPFSRNFVAVRRTSLAARDSVMATAHALSIMAELRAIPYAELNPSSNAFQQVLARYQVLTVGGSTFEASVDIETKDNGKLKILSLELCFNLPGTQGSQGERRLSMKEFLYARS